MKIKDILGINSKNKKTRGSRYPRRRRHISLISDSEQSDQERNDQTNEEDKE